jgi:hypothetical protein
MTEDFRFVVDANGYANKDISVRGIPTEGNLVGNLTMMRDKYAGIWAEEVMKQLRECESTTAPGDPMDQMFEA